MSTNKQTEITKVGTNQLRIIREFDAPLEQVWKAWTEKELLDQWWAPKPWRAETKSMDFREGGTWMYCMVGPAGERHWCRADFTSIVPQKSYTGDDAFCDEAGNINKEMAVMHWNVSFTESSDGMTRVEVENTFDSESDLEQIVEMGFKEGFTAAHGNLDELLAKNSVG